MDISIKLMAICLINMYGLEILLLFNANKLHVYIFNGHQNIKYVNSVVFNAIHRHERF